MNIEKMPKVELHRHLELSIRKQTLLDLAPQFGFKIENEEDFKKHFLIDKPMINLGSVLNKFLDTQKLLANEEILERVAYEACEDAYHEGIKILELRYAPTFVAMNHPDLDFQSIHNAFVKGIERGQKDFEICAGLICIIQRILPVKEAEAVTEFAIDNKETFLGLDLADNEEGFDSKPFSPFFMKAKKAGLKITVHSGEANVPKAAWYVKDAIEHLGADRIGHGVRIYTEPEMIEYVKSNNVPLELCPTSNYFTQAVETIESHPFRKLMEAGVKTTINTDDPGIFGIDMNHEYKTLVDVHNFTEQELQSCADNGAEVSFIKKDIKQKFWPRPIA